MESHWPGFTHLARLLGHREAYAKTWMDIPTCLQNLLLLHLDPQFLWTVLLMWDSGKACLLFFCCIFNPVDTSIQGHRQEENASSCMWVLGLVSWSVFLMISVLLKCPRFRTRPRSWVQGGSPVW